MSALGVLVDGKPLPLDEARAFWKRFSSWMEEHPGDLAGFARAEGFASVHPEMHEAGPVLAVSRSTAQRAYGPAPKKASATSGAAPPAGSISGAAPSAGSVKPSRPRKRSVPRRRTPRARTK